MPDFASNALGPAIDRIRSQLLHATNGGGGLPAVDAAVAGFDALPPEFPGRPALAGALAEAMRAVGGLVDQAHVDRAVALCAVAAADSCPRPEMALTRAVIRGFELMFAAGQGERPIDLREALAELDALSNAVGSRRPHADQLRAIRLLLQVMVAAADGNLGAYRHVETTIRQMQDQYGGNPELHARLEGLAAFVATQRTGDRDAVAEQRQRLSTYIDNLEPGDPQRANLGELAELFETISSATEPGGDADDDVAALRAAAERPGLSPMRHASALFRVGLAEFGRHGSDPRLLDAAVGHLSQADAVAPPGVPYRSSYPYFLGLSLLTRFEAGGRRADLNRAIQALEDSRNRMATPRDPMWAAMSWQLARAYRFDGRPGLAVQTGLDGLRGHAWAVLLQSHTDSASVSARHAAGDAIRVARWCIDGGDASSAAMALDAGRGLLLHAATQIRDVGEQLTARGEVGLAGEWRRAVAAGGTELVDGQLRRRVLTVLAGLGGAPHDRTVTEDNSLLDPPSMHEVRAALTALNVDALVYLIPGDTDAGAAVVVPARDHPSILPLPGLNRTFTATVDDGLGAVAQPRAATRDLYPQAQTSGLEQLCDDAWRFVMGPLLDEHLDMPADRPVRLVLIPMGELARVPWHAARHHTASGHAYAVGRAVCSSIASARMLCTAAWRTTPAATGDGLFVADPDPAAAETDLLAARVEAAAIRDALYPQGRYLGRTADGATAPDGPGTRDEVLGWLAGQRSGATLHLACHGTVSAGRGPEDTSYLLLADGARLSAEDLVRTLQDSPASDLSVAVLAACNSGTSGRGYDEAFSVGTALLAAGAHSVISAQWRVPDRQTSALMFMFHHYLRVEGQPPVDALRSAQLWMLDPERKPPVTMSAALWAALDLDGGVGITAWAGFQHSGR